MIRFDFEVEDHEAEAIFDALRGQIVDNILSITKLMSDAESNEALIEGYRRDNKYISNIIDKMKNMKVD